jgi:hypothetical protein
MKQRAELRAQFRGIRMFVYGYGVLDRRVEEFLIGICRQRDSTVQVAWELATVNIFAGHRSILLICRDEQALNVDQRLRAAPAKNYRSLTECLQSYSLNFL